MSQWCIVLLKCGLNTSGTPPDLTMGRQANISRAHELRRRGAGSLRFLLAVALKRTHQAVEGGRRPEAAKVARRVRGEDRSLTGRGANPRARTGSVGAVTAVDVEDMAGDE
jgi:hypothetical protein